MQKKMAVPDRWMTLSGGEAWFTPLDIKVEHTRALHTLVDNDGTAILLLYIVEIMSTLCILRRPWKFYTSDFAV